MTHKDFKATDVNMNKPDTYTQNASNLSGDSVEKLRDVVRNGFQQWRGELEELVQIPSVSDPSFPQGNVKKSALRVAELFRGIGLETRIATAPKTDGEQGAPAVIAHREPQPGKPTVLLYAHHDVQPPGDETLWNTPVFQPTERDGRLYGRGAADDKAGVIAHLAAIRALQSSDIDTGVGITVLIEGEEEIGSPSMQAFMAENATSLKADAIIVADSLNIDVGKPAFTSSLRGLVDLTVEVKTLEQAGHSGLFGGPAPDALTVLSRLIATLHDENGDVNVNGLLHNEDPEVAIDEVEWREDAQISDGVQLMGSGSLSHRLWAKPAIAVLGIDAPPVEGAANILIPMASAKLSLRIPAGQDPQDAQIALTEHLHENAPFGAQIQVTPGELGKPFHSPSEHKAVQIAHESYEAAWDEKVAETGIGASIPVVADFAEAFPNAAILVTGVEDPSSNAHAPNESVHIEDLEKVILSEAIFLAKMGLNEAPLTNTHNG